MKWLFLLKKDQHPIKNSFFSCGWAVLSTGEDNRHVGNRHSERRTRLLVESSLLKRTIDGIPWALASRLLPASSSESILKLESPRQNHRQSKIPKHKPPKLISFFARLKRRAFSRRQNSVFVYLRRDECS